MIRVSAGWNEKQKKLKGYLSASETFEKGKKLLLEMHGLLHERKVYNNGDTFYDDLWNDLTEGACRIISKKETSILWNIWHITRIEDIVANILIKNKDAVFNEDIQKKLNIKIKDTGNAMTRKEMELFNREVKIKELKNYRTKTGKSTRKIIEGLKFEDMKRKVEKQSLQNIRNAGGVTNDEKSIWLLDFWGRKNILGLIMMPITRHQIVHLNDCFNIKEKEKRHAVP